MAKKPIITSDQLRAILDYNPDTGELRWKARTSVLFTASGNRTADCYCRIWNRKFSGKIAGSVNNQGYLTISVFGVVYAAHRVAWSIYHGADPQQMSVDHINMVKSDNRISNLRLASHKENLSNRKKQRNNKSGYKGVIFKKQINKFVASICVNGKNKHLGCFGSADEAYSAYCSAARLLHGEYARLE